MKRFLYIASFLCILQSANPEEATTKSGKKVILNPDFTWKYVPESSETKSAKTATVVLTKSQEQDTELKSESGEFSVWFDSKKWNRAPKPANKVAEFEFENKKRTGYSMIIYEGLEIPMESFAELLVVNARQVDPNASLLETADCKVNGKSGKLVTYTALFSGMKFIFYSFVTSGSKGSIQFTTYTLENKFEQEKEEFHRLISGLVFP
ncbi:DUF3157 family protein [Leptospira gomenensis]|uniref:DUF3157 family protein n=1 Tax=Leptospira gomenensis TaxID=2484974 RepID=A0A5F1YGS6_9LEPT|nr:DUF3157 family protein [Leptospira gomenensis]TGK38679.1 DUF3157 family protein [Leptospira gomenensis]TGK44331.1 DUF3157 family protein [Leptospira gomenensis]TGK49539.1 DUF3157 family protein [Leptospira gomenensis]TGK60791.1 DUF3157 family protein [Leptospira gomenensis]